MVYTLNTFHHFNHGIMKELALILAGLASPIPYDLCTAQPRWIKKKWQGLWVTFLIGTTKEAYTEMLNLHAPGWSSRIVHPPRLFNENLVQCTCEITIPALINGTVHMLTRSAVGIVEIEQGKVKGGYGNPVSNCATAAFKKAAKMWGVASQFQKPAIMMRIEHWEGTGSNKKPVYPKYDPDRAGSPWYTRNQDQVPDDVKKAMREVRNPRNKATSKTAMAKPEPAQDKPAPFPSLAGLRDICGIKNVTITLVGFGGLEPGDADNRIANILRALVKARDEMSATSRREFLVWAQNSQADLTSQKKLEGALIKYEAQLLGGGE